MKIEQSGLVMASEHQSERFEGTVLQSRGSRFAFGRRRIRQTGIPVSQMLQSDRVDISSAARSMTENRYAAGMESSSSVLDMDTGESVTHEQKQMIEEVVSRVIDSSVRISRTTRQQTLPGSSQRLESGAPISRDWVEQASEPDTRSDISLQRDDFRGSTLTITRRQVRLEEEAAAFSARGNVMTADGRQIDFSLDMSLERSHVETMVESFAVENWQQAMNLTDPLVVSLDGNAPVLTGGVFEFDLDMDGEKEMISFTGAGSGFLALDRNGDAKINDGSELFGPGTGNGFNELAAYDTDRNNWIDENDAVFSQLSVWTRDEDGTDRLVSLKEAGIGAIALNYAQNDFEMKNSDNRLQGHLRRSGVFLFENGNVGSIHQIDLAAQNPEAPVGEGNRAGSLQVENPKPEQPDQISNNPFAGLMTAAAHDAPTDENKDIPNPLKELLDRIEELKEKMAALIKKENSFLGKRQDKGFPMFRYHNPLFDSGGSGSGKRKLTARNWYF